jgi:hypothetical protein
VAGIVIALLLVPSFVQAVRASARFAQADSRVMAQEYVRREWPGVRVASELSHPLTWNNVAQSSYVEYLPLYSPSWYHQQGYGLLLANAGKRKSDAWTPDYKPLLEAGREVASFGGRDSDLLGPRIDVIETGLTPAAIAIYTPEIRLGALQVVSTTIGVVTKQGSQLMMEPGHTIRPGRVLATTVFWDASAPVLPSNYTTFLHLRDQEGRTLVQRDAPVWQGLFPPDTWRPGALVVERLDMWLPYELPPGEYRLVMGLYDSATQQRFAAFAGDRQLEHDELDLGVVEVVEW